MYRGQRIYANTNLNSVINPGMYRCMLYADAASLSNSPVKWPFNLIVIDPVGGSGYCTQILAHNGGSGLVGLYIRAEYGGAWSDWKQL
ncbi:pyocin knob domain-containing protein [Adlercreutzia caecimuris]|uniref:pyocin knob domain-containing protein n=1 Tax=Adlercreutzia caecimuris TaxID=671266 RepID=UPI001C3EE64E|nr:pyocin knob domain-containing protein [Adlercreutzia caecimuris]